jgi:hypothetical protein
VQQRVVPVASVGVLAVLTLVLWLTVFARSSSSPESSGASDGQPGDVVTATPTTSASPSPKASPTRTPEASPSETAKASPSPSTSPSPSASPAPSDSATGAPPDEEPQVELTSTSLTGEPYETVPLRGVVDGVDAGTTLRVQHLLRGRWQSFPIPTTTDSAGRFTAYVELGGPGRYQLRVIDPATGITSPVATLEIG